MKQACVGDQKLNKIAFLSMIGARKYVQGGRAILSAEEQRVQILNDALTENNNDLAKASASLGISPSVFKKRLNYLSTLVSTKTINDEPASPTPQRRFFEKLSSPWSITSFNSKNREVCIDIQAGPTTTHLSSTVPDYRS